MSGRGKLQRVEPPLAGSPGGPSGPSEPVDISGVTGRPPPPPLFTLGDHGEMRVRLGESPTAATQTTPSLERRRLPGEEEEDTGAGDSCSRGRSSYWEHTTTTTTASPAAPRKSRSHSLPETSLKAVRIILVGRQLRAVGNLYDALKTGSDMAAPSVGPRPSSYPRVSAATGAAAGVPAPRHQGPTAATVGSSGYRHRAPRPAAGPHHQGTPPQSALALPVYELWSKLWAESTEVTLNTDYGRSRDNSDDDREPSSSTFD